MRFNGRATTDAQALLALVGADGSSGGFVKDADRATDAEARAQSSSVKVLTPANLAARASFSAVSATNQSVATGTTTKVNFATVGWDTAPWYNNSTMQAAPAGKVRLSASIYATGATAATAFGVYLYKGGVLYRTLAGAPVTSAGDIIVSGSCLVDSNGSDLYDIRVNGTTAGSITLQSGFCVFECEQL